MRVLVVGINYAPEATGIALYTSGLAEHLASRGDDVTVVAGLPSYPQWRVYDGYGGVLGQRESIRGVDVRRRWHHVPRRQSAARRGLYEVTFLCTGLSALALPRPDAILGVVPSLSGGVVARLAGRRFRAPYGLVFQDLVGPAAAQSGVEGSGWTASVVRAAERFVVRDAEAVGVIAEGFRPYLEGLGVDPGRIRRARNWTHVAVPTLDQAAARDRLGLSREAVICLHAGNMGYKQGLANVVECARLAASPHPELLFVLVGDGNQRARLEELASGHGLANVRFLPIQPAELFSSMLAAADILLLNQLPSVTDMSLPGKLTSYFFSGRPVLAAVSESSEAAREVRDSRAGLVIPPGDPRSLLEALLALAADRSHRERLGAAGADYARRTLTAEQALTDLESLVDTIAAGRGHAQTVTMSP